MTLGGAGVGLLVESHMGRPTKIEGNPDHPASLGATDIFHQASVLTLYDPDRSQTVTHLGQTRTWDEALAALHGRDRQHSGQRGGAGLARADRNRRLADARAATCTTSSRLSRGEMAPVRAARPRQRLPAERCWPSAKSSTRTTISASRRRPFPRRRLSDLRPGQPPLRRRLHGAAARAHDHGRRPSRPR